MFEIDRGATESFTIEVLDQDDELVSLTGAKIYFTVRVADEVVISKANTDAGGGDEQIQVTGVGTFKLKFTADDTNREPMIGICDGWVITALGERLKAIRDQPFQIRQSQTRVFPGA